LAQMIGISTNLVFRMYKNEDQPSLNSLLQIANALGVNIRRVLIQTANKDNIRYIPEIFRKIYERFNDLAWL
jgi:transcriptional regulator with XRE-family HTH domain